LHHWVECVRRYAVVITLSNTIVVQMLLLVLLRCGRSICHGSEISTGVCRASATRSTVASSGTLCVQSQTLGRLGGVIGVVLVTVDLLGHHHLAAAAHVATVKVDVAHVHTRHICLEGLPILLVSILLLLRSGLHSLGGALSRRVAQSVLLLHLGVNGIELA
jgi:hypothetical protein